MEQDPPSEHAGIVVAIGANGAVLVAVTATPSPLVMVEKAVVERDHLRTTTASGRRQKKANHVRRYHTCTGYGTLCLDSRSSVVRMVAINATTRYIADELRCRLVVLQRAVDMGLRYV